MHRTALVRDESSPREVPKGANPFGKYLLEHQGGVLVLDDSHLTYLTCGSENQGPQSGTVKYV